MLNMRKGQRKVTKNGENSRQLRSHLKKIELPELWENPQLYVPQAGPQALSHMAENRNMDTPMEPLPGALGGRNFVTSVDWRNTPTYPICSVKRKNNTQHIPSIF